MIVPKRKITLDIAIPGSLGLQVKQKMIRTFIIGMVGRFAAMYRVDKVIIYRDRENDASARNQKYIEDILWYMTTPQYLRKRIIPKNRIFKYVGVLPPLQTPSHPKFKPISKFKNGEYREGVIIGFKENKYEVDIGSNKSIFLPITEKNHKIGERLIFKVISIKKGVKFKIVNKSEIPHYWCFSIENFMGTLRKLIQSKRKYYSLIIGTSRWGVNIEETKKDLLQKMSNIDSILVIFGGFNAGIYDMLNTKRGSEIQDIDYVINFIPDQGTKTIRTEEAINSVLSILNYLIK